MVEHDTFTVSVKKIPVNQSPAVLSLITQERTQKLELLIHLLANLPQPLVVCGPEGIGKTTLVRVLQERGNQSWLFCPVQGSSDLSFEAIQESLSQRMGLDNSQSLASALNRHNEQNKRIILIIDDAGVLVPGLISIIVQYGAAHPVLRVVFVLTHDELHVHSKSDKVLDDCHVIEIPPLSEKQCGDFLQVLSNQASTSPPPGRKGQRKMQDSVDGGDKIAPGSVIEMPIAQMAQATIDEHLIETVYRETHGIPGKIIRHIPDFSIDQQGSQGKWWMAVAVAALVVIALAVQYSSPTIKDNNASPAVEPQASVAPAAVQPVAPPISEVLPSAQTPSILPETTSPVTVEEQLTVETVNPPEPMVNVTIEPQDTQAAVDTNEYQQSAPAPVAPKQVAELPKVSAPQIAPVAKKAPEVLVNPAKKPEAEIALPQTGEYTLQLIVLSKQASIDDIQRKYPALRSSFRVVKTISGGQERFALMYGSFDSAASANKARQSLPPEFRNALARKAGSR